MKTVQKNEWNVLYNVMRCMYSISPLIFQHILVELTIKMYNSCTTRPGPWHQLTDRSPSIPDLAAKITSPHIH